METQEKLSFSTNAKLGKLSGRELITNNIIAVFELIKNSYDAFASKVCIEFINFDTSGTDKEITNRSKRNVVISDSASRIVISCRGHSQLGTKFITTKSPNSFFSIDHPSESS